MAGNDGQSRKTWILYEVCDSKDVQRVHWQGRIFIAVVAVIVVINVGPGSALLGRLRYLLADFNFFKDFHFANHDIHVSIYLFDNVNVLRCDVTRENTLGIHILGTECVLKEVGTFAGKDVSVPVLFIFIDVLERKKVD